jgi:hypothetical protein
VSSDVCTGKQHVGIEFFTSMQSLAGSVTFLTYQSR